MTTINVVFFVSGIQKLIISSSFAHYTSKISTHILNDIYHMNLTYLMLPKGLIIYIYI